MENKPKNKNTLVIPNWLAYKEGLTDRKTFPRDQPFKVKNFEIVRENALSLIIKIKNTEIPIGKSIISWGN